MTQSIEDFLEPSELLDFLDDVKPQTRRGADTNRFALAELLSDLRELADEWETTGIGDNWDPSPTQDIRAVLAKYETQEGS